MLNVKYCDLISHCSDKSLSIIASNLNIKIYQMHYENH